MKETDIFALRELVELRDDAAALEENSTDAGHILFRSHVSSQHQNRPAKYWK